jgi:hypothetical protein
MALTFHWSLPANGDGRETPAAPETPASRKKITAS